MPQLNCDHLERDFENFRKLANTNTEEFSDIEKSLRIEIDDDLPSLKSLMELVEILEIKNRLPYWQKTNIFPSDQQQLEIKKEIIALLNRAVTIHTLDAGMAFLWLAEKQESIEKQCEYFRTSLKFGIAKGLTSAWKYWSLAMRFSDNPALKNDAIEAFSIAAREGLDNIHPNREPARSIWDSARNLNKITADEPIDIPEKSIWEESIIQARNVSWTMHGRSINEYIRSQFPDCAWEKLAVINLQDLLTKNLVDISPGSGMVFIIGNDARFIAKVGGEESVLCNFKERIQNRNYNIYISYYEYPTYPLIYILLQTQPLKDYAMQSIKILADFAEVNFQEFAIILNKNKSMFIDIFNEHNKNIASEKVEVQKEFCYNIVEYIDRANSFFEKINIPVRNFAKAGQLFLNEHLLPMPQSVIDKPKESSEIKNILKETMPNVHNKRWKLWIKYFFKSTIL